MKALICKSLDGPAGVELAELDEPTAGAGEVVVEVTAAALNFLDTLITRGKYQYRPDLPFSPAAELAGRVAALGAGVSGPKVGDRVCAYLGWGAARERVLARPEQLVPVPATVSDEIAAGISVTYGTAMHGLKDRARLQPGETVAVLGATSAAGIAAIEIAKVLGARVIAAGSSEERLAACRAHGADATFNYTTGDLRQGLKELTAGRGCDVVYDCVGGSYAEPALRSTAWLGRYVVIGFASGEIPRFPLNLILLKHCDVIGVFWGEATARDPAPHRQHMEQVLTWIEAGRLKPRIGMTLPLAAGADGIRALDERRALGKVVLTL
jgi:NADPH2:quinone reductase